MAVYDNALLIVGDSQGKLDHQLRPQPIHLFSIILIYVFLNIVKSENKQHLQNLQHFCLKNVLLTIS